MSSYIWQIKQNPIMDQSAQINAYVFIGDRYDRLYFPSRCPSCKSGHCWWLAWCLCPWWKTVDDTPGVPSLDGKRLMVAQWNPGDGSSDGKCLNIVITLYWCLAFFFPFTGTDLSCDHLHCWWWMAMKPHKLVNGYPWIDLSSFSWFSQSSWLDHIFSHQEVKTLKMDERGRTLCEGKGLFTDACFRI